MMITEAACGSSSSDAIAQHVPSGLDYDFTRTAPSYHAMQKVCSRTLILHHAPKSLRAATLEKLQRVSRAGGRQSLAVTVRDERTTCESAVPLVRCRDAVAAISCFARRRRCKQAKVRSKKCDRIDISEDE